MDLKAFAERVASKHLQAAQKPTDIVLDVIAISSSRGKQYKHKAFVRPSPYKKGTFIVVIDGTAGQWNVDDFIKDRGPLYIDFGQGWVLDNADEVRAAVRKWQSAEGAGRTASNFYKDLPLDEIGAKLAEAVRDLRFEAYEASQRADRVEKAWGQWDVDTLVDEGVLDQTDQRHLREAWEAQQQGDEQAMERHLSQVRIASNHDIMAHILPQRDVMKLMSEMRKEGDEQSADLVYEVYSAISERLDLSDNEAFALSRLKGSVDSVGRWDAGLQRNNIFKAANLLGIKLPSSMF